MRTFIFTIVFIMTSTSVCFSQVSDSLSTKKELNKLIIYGSDTCHYCLDTKAYLEERKKDFIYYDVDVNLTKQREMLIKMQKAGIPVDNLLLPVIHKNDKIFMNNGDFDDFLKRLID